MLAFANRRTQIDDLLWKLYAVMHSIFYFAPFILIQFDFTNAHVDNYNAIASISRFESREKAYEGSFVNDVRQKILLNLKL